VTSFLFRPVIVAAQDSNLFPHCLFRFSQGLLVNNPFFCWFCPSVSFFYVMEYVPSTFFKILILLFFYPSFVVLLSLPWLRHLTSLFARYFFFLKIFFGSDYGGTLLFLTLPRTFFLPSAAKFVHFLCRPCSARLFFFFSSARMTREWFFSRVFIVSPLRS